MANLTYALLPTLPLVVDHASGVFGVEEGRIFARGDPAGYGSGAMLVRKSKSTPLGVSGSKFLHL